MAKYIVTFAGLSILIQYDNSDNNNTISHFLDLLFNDLHCSSGNDFEAVLEISQKESNGQYILSSNSETLFQGSLGVECAAVLFDQVIFNLLNNKKDGVAIHSGAVSYQNQMILLPGQSGSGKSNMTAWLTAHNFSYLTDELIFLPDDDSGQAIPFTRPLCIKSAAITAIKEILPQDALQAILEDEQGAIAPHRLLNPDFSMRTSAPALIIFPAYQATSPLSIEKISGAQACTLLMACDVNGRNLVDHGFKQIALLARSIPAYRVTYSSFSGFDDALAELLVKLKMG